MTEAAAPGRSRRERHRADSVRATRDTVGAVTRRVGDAHGLARWLSGTATTRDGLLTTSVPRPVPLVAVLCQPARGRAAASGVALALAGALGEPCALAAAAGVAAAGSLAGAPTARRAAARVRDRGLPAAATGRLAWLADRRGRDVVGDDAASAAALSAELGRAAAAAGAPAAVALPIARTAALDRVLAWHDAIVVVRDPGMSDAVLERGLASLAMLGRPVAAMAPPTRLTAALAAVGLRAPAEAAVAVAQLGLGGPREEERRGA